MTQKSESKALAKEQKLSENDLLMQRLFKLDEENRSLKKQLADEATRIRIPNKLNAFQFNQLVGHLAKIREDFMMVLEVPSALEIETKA